MRSFFFAVLVLLTIPGVEAQDKKPYQIYTKTGQESDYGSMLKAASKSDVVLFGEYHDNSIVHWLQFELTKDLSSKRKLVLGAEMFEADNQKALDQYLNGTINQKQLDSTARLWKNYKTDYKPLVDFAKTNKFPFVATNIPRKYANMVYKNGFESLNALSVEEKSWMAPLPIDYDAQLPGYVNMMKAMEGHGGDNLPKAQAMKDATMAYFIWNNLKPESTFVHYNGTYHSDNFEGIYWYLTRKDPKLKIMTIATVSQKDIKLFKKEDRQKADFIIVVDEDVTKTH